MTVSRKIIAAGLLASVAACSPKKPPAPPPPPPVAIVIPPRPLPPGNAAHTQILPGRGVDGRFVTANTAVTGDRAFWQLKIGLNVAAIGCRGLEETTLVSAYNNIIKTHGKVIKSTEKSVIAQLGKENRNNGIAPRDRLSTQLFNYFAQPPAQRGFCARASGLSMPRLPAAPSAARDLRESRRLNWLMGGSGRKGAPAAQGCNLDTSRYA